MLDDFFIRALLAGSGLAVIAGPLGCIVIWRRLSYLGDTLSHAALLGVAMAYLFDMNMMLSVFIVAGALSLALMTLQKRIHLSSDALLGLLSHSALAIGLVVLSLMTWVRIDLSALLFGDILAVSKGDLAIIGAGILIIPALLSFIWPALIATTVSPDIARAEGLSVERINFIFMMLTAMTIALAMKIIGALLITALLIIPAAAARNLARSPETMAVVACLIGIFAVNCGLMVSLYSDTPAGPSIVVSALFLFLLGLVVKRKASHAPVSPSKT